MRNFEILMDQADIDTKLLSILRDHYGPSHQIDLLKECIKILQPYAEKEREKTHA